MKNNNLYKDLTEDKIREYLEEVFYGQQEKNKDQRRVRIFFLGSRKQFNEMMSKAMKEHMANLRIGLTD